MINETLTAKEVAAAWAKFAEEFPDTKLSFSKAAIATLEIFGIENACSITSDYGEEMINTNVTYDEETGEVREMTEEDYNN